LPSTLATEAQVYLIMERVGCCVIGGGILGLAVARRLAVAGREVILLESEAGIGTQTSSRNSEVIERTRTRTNTNPNGTEANAAGRSGNARALRKQS